MERARALFDVSRDYSGVGECQLVLAQRRLNKELLEEAFNNFENAQPVPNTAGMLECVEVRGRSLTKKPQGVAVKSSRTASVNMFCKFYTTPHS